MPIESTVNYITDLNPLWPLGGDDRSTADDHDRNIKDALLGSFAGFVGAAVNATEAELNVLASCTTTTAILNSLKTAQEAVAANVIPIRDASGDLLGNILGNAATADDATLLNSQAASYYLDAANMTGVGTLPLGVLPTNLTGKNAASLIGLSASIAELDYAHSPNTANKFCLLDASADVPLAQIPDTLTGKNAELHNGLYAQYGTTTLTNTANGAVSAATDVALTSITAVYGVTILESAGPGVSIAAAVSGGYVGFGGDAAWAGSSYPSAPSVGNVRFAFYNATGGATTCPIKYIIYGT